MSSHTEEESAILDAHIDTIAEIAMTVLSRNDTGTAPKYRIVWQGNYLDSYMYVVLVIGIPNQLISICTDCSYNVTINCTSLDDSFHPDHCTAAVDALKARVCTSRIDYAEYLKREISSTGASVSH